MVGTEDDTIVLISKLIHEEFRKVIQRAKSKIATYTGASYNLVNTYNSFENNPNPEMVDLDNLINEVWKDYGNLNDYLFELDQYDKDFHLLNDNVKEKFINLSKKIIMGDEIKNDKI